MRIVIADADTLTALVESETELFREDAGRHDLFRNVDWPVQHGTAFFSTMLDDPDRLLLLAYDDESPIGHLVGTIRPPDAMFPRPLATLMSIRVAPRIRGQGVGKLLIDRFLEWARSRGAVQAKVSAFAGNRRAQQLYVRHGFTPHDVTMSVDL